MQFKISNVSKQLLLFMVLCIFYLSPVQAQYYFERANPVPVNIGSTGLSFPWAGGLNNAHFSDADLNNDGIMDLVVFERSDNILLTFLNNGTANTVDYQYAPEYEKNFPETVHWVLMEDFNCDGITDLFTNNDQYTDIYVGKYDNNELVFEYVDYLKFQASSGITHIFIASVNMPAIADINNDGDLDILTFDFASNSYIEYYENMSMELSGSCGDTTFYVLADDCWGNIYESGSARTAEIRDTCGFLIPKTSGLHAGGTMLAADLNGDSIKELIMGTLSFPSLNRMINSGSPDTAMIAAQDTFFPSYDTPVEMPFNAAPFLVDVNNDGLEDLIVSPNARNISENFKCVQYYKNIGTANNMTFSLASDSFMVGDMLDFGSTSKPVFFDHNDDGLLDIVVGNQDYYKQFSPGVGKLALLENIGSAGNPEFQLLTRDYANLSTLGLVDLYPAFGDIDDDGDDDMIIGEEDGELYLFENTAGPGNPAIFSLQAAQYKNIDVGKYSTPFLYDLNKDGLLDLLVGEQNGNVNYHQNTGTKTVADFNAVATNKELGEIDTRELGSIQGYSTPSVTKLTGSNSDYIVTGSFAGKVYLYEIDPSKLTTGAFAERTDLLTQTTHGFHAHTTVADINNDGEKEMLVGSERGGLVLFTESDIALGTENSAHLSGKINVYPNPADHQINILFPDYHLSKDINLVITGVHGRVAAESVFVNPDKIITLHINLHPGLYIVRITASHQNYFQKFIVE